MGNTMNEPNGANPSDGKPNGVTEANEQKKRALLDFLNGHSDDEPNFEEGVSAYGDTERIIARELAKGDDLDADLLFEAAELHLAQSGEPMIEETPEEREARLKDGWNELLRQHEIRQAHSNEGSPKPVSSTPGKRPKQRRVLRKIAAAVACCLLLGTLSISAAYAFNWEFLIHFFQPLMETLGIHMNLDESEQAGDLAKSNATPEPAQEETELPGRVVSQRIMDIAQVPDEIMGYRAKPTWIPEGYAFEYADYLDDVIEKNVFIAYGNGEDSLFVQVQLYADPALIATNSIEAQPEQEGVSEIVDGILLTEDRSMFKATYTDDLAYYMVWGKLSKEDILSAITSMIRSESS